MALKVGSTYTLNITELAGLGDGVAFVEGQKVFVPYTVSGDRVEARIIKTGKEFSQAELIDIVSSGKSRRTPPCRHFYQCGGCSLQHVQEESYTVFKRNILVQAVARAGLDTSVVAPLVYIGPRTRRRTVLKVSNGQIGYYKAKSHALFDVEECPILEEPLEALLPHLKILVEKISHSKAIHEIALSLSDTGIDAVIASKEEAILADLETLAVFAKDYDLAGISWQNAKGELIPVVQRRTIEMKVTDDISVAIPSGSFQQATKAGQQAITQEIIGATSKASRVLDLYAGCGGYSFAMAGYTKVHAVEGDAAMTTAILNAARKYELAGKVSAEQRDLVRSPFQAKELDKFDAVVINPPRNGAKAQAEFLAKSQVPVIAMVSCNPVTFSTDAKILAAGGYTLKRAVPIDQFVWSPHLELVAIFQK